MSDHVHSHMPRVALYRQYASPKCVFGSFVQPARQWCVAIDTVGTALVASHTEARLRIAGWSLRSNAAQRALCGSAASHGMREVFVAPHRRTHASCAASSAAIACIMRKRYMLLQGGTSLGESHKWPATAAVGMPKTLAHAHTLGALHGAMRICSPLEARILGASASPASAQLIASNPAMSSCYCLGGARQPRLLFACEQKGAQCRCTSEPHSIAARRRHHISDSDCVFA